MVMAFGAAIGLSQEQLERMRTEVIAQTSTSGLPCSSCGAENSADSRFCSKCGSNLTVLEPEAHANYEISRIGITIEFAESSGASFPKALALLLQNLVQNSSNAPRTKRFGIWRISQAGTLLMQLLHSAETLSGLRNRVLYINGQNEQWDEVFSFLWCMNERSNAYRPIEYCFGKDEHRINPWGCRLTRMEWSERCQPVLLWSVGEIRIY